MNLKKIITKLFIIIFIYLLVSTDLFAQNSQFLEEWYWGQGNFQYYVLNKDVVHGHVNSDRDLFCEPYNGAIVYQEEYSDLLSIIVDPFWNRLIYSKYDDNWIKDYGAYGPGQGQFKNPNAVSTDGLGNLYVADTYNGRIIPLEYNSTNKVIDTGSLSTIGEGILQQPWDLDVDDMGNLDPSDDVIWVADNGAGQIVPFNPDGSLWQNKTITSLISDNTVYDDITGVCGIAIRKEPPSNPSAIGVNSTEEARIYMADWKQRKLFLVEANSSCSPCHSSGGAEYIYKEKTFADNVVLSGVESDYFGDVWAVDNANNKIYKYTWDFEYLDQISGLNRPTSIASVRRHHLNMAITEQWTNTTGNRTYSHGANIRNLGINPGYTTANFDFLLTNFCYLEANVYQNGSYTTLEDGVSVSPSGTMSLNYYKSNPSGTYTLFLKAKSFDDPDGVYKDVSQSFYFPLKPVTISVPGQLMWKQKYTYPANTSGGSDDNISYQWYRKYQGSSYWYTLGTASTQLVTMLNKSFYLKVEVSSGNESSEYTKYIQYDNSPPVGKTQVEALPEEYSLKNNYPNPFNPFTTIKYDLPENSFVELFIFNLLGREVKSLIHANIEAGFRSITWDSKDNNGKPLPSGVYLYLITAKSLTSEKTFSNKKKMVLLK